MAEFLQSYGLYIFVAVLFVLMFVGHGHGVGCGMGGHRHRHEEAKDAKTGRTDDSSSLPPTGCH